MRMRPTVTMTVFACFAEITTPTFVLRRKRRQPVASPSGAAFVFATVAAVRLRTVMALPAVATACGFGAASFVATAAFATVFRAAAGFSAFSGFSATAAFFAAGAFAAAAFVVVFFVVVFSAI